jgi:mRNA interferase MazF
MTQTPSMTDYKKGDIVLVSFPFTDLTTTKQRPALIISPEQYNQGADVVIAFITSNLNSPRRYRDYPIKEWQTAGLPKPSIVRMKFATVEKGIVIKKLGEIQEKDKQEIEQQLVDFFTD